MASSQPSSPTRSASPDRFELSPASKLKQLLATVDSDSDDATPRPVMRRPQIAQLASQTSEDTPAGISSGEGSNEDDVVRPRGRLAARMQGGATTRDGDARQHVRKLMQKNDSAEIEMGDAEDDDQEDVVRPRGKLASRMQGSSKAEGNDITSPAGKSPSQATTGEQQTGASEDVDMADDDDEDVLVPARNPRHRQTRNSTPDPMPSTPRREESPGLFVTTPPSRQESVPAGSDSERDLPALKSNRFKALVEKKRQERLAREAKETEKKEARAAALEELGDDNDDDVSDISDDDGGRRLTQTQSRPSRKASKKALEEMNRETQRMQRAMQLAHEAKTKKKITKATLFEKFNFKPNGSLPTTEKLQSSSRPHTPVSTRSTDADMQDAATATPPSSPPARVEDVLGKDLTGVPSQTCAAAPLAPMTTTEGVGQDQDEESPDLMDISAFARKPLNKDTGKAATPEPRKQTPIKAAPKRQVRVKLPAIQANHVYLGSEDEDELTIVDKKKTKLDAIFDRVPKNKAKESSSARMLRQLAHLDSPERKAYKKNDKTAMTLGELQAQLQQRAREQAKRERERRLEMLKSKGIHIQSEEERARDREQIEDMVARARREAEEIMDREREQAKKDKKAARGDDPLAWDDSGSDNGDYEGDGDDEDDAEVDWSGSEEEDETGLVVGADDEDEAEQDALEAPPAAQNLVDETADEVSDGEGSATGQSWVDPDEEEERHRWGVVSDEDMDETPAFVQARRPKKALAVVSDDEDLEIEATPRPKTQTVDITPTQSIRPVNFTPGPNKNTSPDVPTSVLRSAAKTFIPGLPVEAGGPAGLGLTQIFAGTMDESQSGPLGGSPSQPMPTFDMFPDSQFSQNVTSSANAMILDSQAVPASQAGTQNEDGETQVQLDFQQSQTHGLDSLVREDLATQTSEMLELSQDGGFQDWTPLRERFVEHPASTVETVVRASSETGDISHDSPLLQKRGRLRRKAVIASDSEDDQDDDVAIKPSVFSVMKDAATKEKGRKLREEFDRKKSKAKGMVEEQAEESEDEYAGLGGVDGEDSDDDDAASVHEMIDDQTQGNKEEDELKIAALYAERERAEDAKQTDKLFHDITRGMLRRKRGADYDLSDSDDGGEARRRMKRRQFAKMQKALFTDERISKVAENPRNQAFMRTIEDMGSDDEMDFLFEAPPEEASGDGQIADSQDKGAQTTVPDSQPPATAPETCRPPKRAAASERRTKNGRRPANIGEIRETLSSLLEEPSGNTVISATDAGSDSEGEDDGGGGGDSANKENANPRRGRRGAQNVVVDRISLKRQGSSSNKAGGAGRMAFAAPSSSSSGGGSFKVPALLRRATTNSLVGTSTTTTTTTGGGGGFGDEAKIKKNAGKRSGISYLARETDRRAKMADAEKRREQKKFRAVEGRSKVVGGLFGAGKFE